MKHYITSLYCGRDKPGHPVTYQEVELFEDEVISYHFPSGWTRFFASGGWRSPTMLFSIKEGTAVFQVVHANSPSDQQKLRDIANAWKQLFKQDSVLMTTVEAEVTFV